MSIRVSILGYLFLMGIFSIFVHADKRTYLEQEENNVILSEDELKLMYQTFIYKSELEMAYKVAKKALNRYPNNLEWHRKMAEVAQWSGRAKLSLNHWLVIYSHEPTVELRQKIIDKSLLYYRYEEAQALIKDEMLEKASQKNIDLFIYVWEESGNPEFAAATLYEVYKKDRNNIYALERTLNLYMNLGYLKEMKKIIATLDSEKFLSLPISVIISQYYYVLQDIDKSFEVLLVALAYGGEDATYLREFSDLAWYLDYKEKAVQASFKLDKLGKATLQDYERIILFSQKDPFVAKEIALKGWSLYGKPYFFYTYAYLALESKSYNELLKQIAILEANTSYFDIFKSDEMFYLIKAQASQGAGKIEEATKAFEEALRLSPNNLEIYSQMIWLYMDAQDASSLKKIIRELEKREVAYDLYLPLAAAHFFLQESDRAKTYVLKLLKTEKNNVDLKLLYAYILQVENEPQAFMKQMKEVDVLLQKQIDLDPSLLKQNNFLDRYLRVKIYLINPDVFVSKLKNAKQYLSDDSYANISFLWSLRNNAHEQARMQLRYMRNTESWMLLGQSLHFQNHLLMQTILYKHYISLPTRDKVTAARTSGNVSFAYSLAFDGLQENKRDELLYQQLRDHAVERGDTAIMEAGTHSRDFLQQQYLLLDSNIYLSRGYWLHTDIELYKNSSNRGYDIYSEIEEETIFSLSLKKEFDKGSFLFGLGYRESFDKNLFAKTAFEWKINSRINVLLKGGYRYKAAETIPLLIEGSKTYGSLNLRYTLLPSTQLSLFLERAEYYFEGYNDGANTIGDGSIGRLGVDKVFHVGYPDITTSFFAEFGKFNKYIATDTLVVPDDYANLGATFMYGMQNKNTYTRVWTPYFSVSPFYEITTGNVSYFMSGGIGGAVYNQDHAVLGFDYVDALRGTGENLFKFFLEYKFIY